MNRSTTLVDDQMQSPSKASRSLRGEQILIPGHQELRDISVPMVFHKPRQLLTIVLGKAGGSLLSLSHPIAFPGIEHSLPISNLAPDEGGEMTAHIQKGQIWPERKGCSVCISQEPFAVPFN